MAARSTEVTLVNGTSNTSFHLIDTNLDHGVWTTQPPTDIPPGGQASWESESSGLGTGTEGTARYYPVDAHSDNIGIPSPLPDAETVFIHWDNPFSGSNSYSTPAPNPLTVKPNGDGGGDNAAITFDVVGAFGPDTCAEGYVWREAFPGDHVCVLPEVRAQVQQDNAQAAARRNPAGGPFGPDTCLQGFVWREANAGDHVCVLPQTRTQAHQDNAEASRRTV